MLELPQRVLHRPPVILPPPGKTALLLMLAKRLPLLIEERMRLDPSKRTSPVAEVQSGIIVWRWAAHWSRERSWGISSVLAMLFVVLSALAGQGLAAVTRHRLSAALDVVSPTTTTTIDKLMGKCVLRTELPLQVVIGRHVPAVAVEGMVPQLFSAKIDTIELKRADNGLENGMRRVCVSFAKPVSQSSAVLDETPLGSRMQINDGPQSKPATLITTSKPSTSGYPEKFVAMIEEIDTRQMYAVGAAHCRAYGSKGPLPFAATKYNQTPEVACCLLTADRWSHLEHLTRSTCDCLPDVADPALASTAHMSWFDPFHRDGYLKLQPDVTSNPEWLFIGAYLEFLGNRGSIGIVIPDTPEEDGPAGALEDARPPPKPDSQFSHENVVTPATLDIPTGDVGFCSSHRDSDLKAKQIIGNRLWLMSSVDVGSGRIGGWFLGFLDKLALFGSQWKLTLWKLAAQTIQAMVRRWTARHEGVQASMAWREETGSFQSMRLHPAQVIYAMKHNYDGYPPSKNRVKDVRARRCMRHKRMRQATYGYGGCILGDGFSRTSFGHAAAVAISTSGASVTGPVKVWLWPLLYRKIWNILEAAFRTALDPYAVFQHPGGSWLQSEASQALIESLNHLEFL
ncbi:hypothetical protein BU17DRAFT_97081 [Hysterangium stoloniferum]|nr:hypothetical protein BU17DRAFT_97081 [Hysterangium stoloniferum]